MDIRITNRGAVFDFLERLRREHVDANAAAADGRLLTALQSMSDDHDLYDACCAKIVDPGTDRATFDLIASRDPHSLGIMLRYTDQVWQKAGHNVRDVLGREFHQDIPELFYELSLRLPEGRARVGALRVAAYISFHQGDPQAAVQYHLGHLFEAAPYDPEARNLDVAFRDRILPAWQTSPSTVLAQGAGAAERTSVTAGR